MSKKVIGYIVTLVVLAVAVTGGVYYAVVQHNKPLTQEQFAKLPIEEQFKKAPAGHYVHLRKNDSTLYRTTWSKDQFHNYIIKYGKAPTSSRGDGTTNEKSKLGTAHIFDDTKIYDSELNVGELGSIYFPITSNSKFTTWTPDESTTYNWYFNNLKAAEKDADVSANVTQIYR